MADVTDKAAEGLEPDTFDLAFEAAAGSEPPPAAEEKTPPAAEKPAEPPPAATEPTAEEKAAAAKAEADRQAAATKAETERKAATEKAEAERKADTEKTAAEHAAQEQFTAEEQEAIEANAKNFPETHKAYEARERVLVTKLTNKFMSELAAVKAEFSQQIAPVASTMAANSFEAAVLRSHPDAFDVLSKVDAWVATKPAFMQQQINDILDKGVGGPQATIDVLTFFKAETASSAQTPGPSAEETAVAAAKAAAEQAEKEKKLQAQEGVRSRQVAKKGGIDEDDFESAFKAAANS